MKLGTKGLRLNYSAVYISIQLKHRSTISGEFGNLTFGIENGQNSYRRSEYARRARRTCV
jgi:hypothetical protein